MMARKTETLSRHIAPAQFMARFLRRDLALSLLEGDMDGQTYGKLLDRCQQCGSSDCCLAQLPLGRHPSGFCANYRTFMALPAHH